MSKSFKKWILISLIVLTATIVAVFAYALSNANKLIAQFKPQLEDTISKALNTKVKLGEIKASIFPETALRVSSLDLEQANKQIVGPKFDQLVIRIDLTQLLQAKLAIREVSLKNPQIKFIKTASDNSGNESAKKPESNDTAVNQNQNISSPLEINLDSFKLDNARFEFEDAASKKNYVISNINLDSSLSVQAKNIELKNFAVNFLALEKIPVSFTLPKLNFSDNKLSIDSFISKLAEQSLAGNLNFSLTDKSGNIQIGSEALELQKLSETAKIAVPNLPAIEIAGQLVPNFQASIQNSNQFNAKGNLGLNKISLKQGNFEFADVNGNISVKANNPDTAELNSSDINFKLNNQAGDLAFKLNHQDKKLKIYDLVLNFLGGNLNTQFDFDLASKAFSSKLKAVNLQIASALTLIKKDNLALSGNIDSLSSNLQGTLSDKPLPTLRGKAQASLSNGAFKGFNLAGIVLKAINNLPFLTGSLYSSLPADQQAAFNSEDTAFSALSTDLNFIESGISVQSMSLKSPTFEIEAKGIIGFDNNLSLSAKIYFSKQFSSMLVASTDKLKYALDDSGRLVVPLTITGKAPSVIVLPDVQKLIEAGGKKVLAEKAGELASELLKKKGLGGLLGF